MDYGTVLHDYMDWSSTICRKTLPCFRLEPDLGLQPTGMGCYKTCSGKVGLPFVVTPVSPDEYNAWVLITVLNASRQAATVGELDE